MKEFKNKLTPSELRLAKKLFEAWMEQNISGGNAEDLCFSIKMKCNKRTLETLTKRGLLEKIGEYYKIKYEVFE